MDALIRLVKKYHRQQYNAYVDVLPEVVVYGSDAPVVRQVSIEKPFCALNLQGEKQMRFGGQAMWVSAGELNLSVVDMPLQANIVKATPASPFYCLILYLDLDAIAHMVNAHHLQPPKPQPFQRLVSDAITAPIADAFYRLLALAAQPSAVPILLPLIKQEIYYRLLQLPNSTLLYQAIQQGSHQQQIGKATQFLRQHFAKPLSVQTLAAAVQMSPSNFYRHFRQITGISPLQFQKQLRLQQARALILAGKDVSAAAFAVGYESLSQFSREYKRHFGVNPSQEKM